MKPSSIKLLTLSVVVFAWAVPAFAGGHFHRAAVQGHGARVAPPARPAEAANFSPRRRFEQVAQGVPQSPPRRFARPLPHLLEPGRYVLTTLPPYGAEPPQYEEPLAWRYAEPELLPPRRAFAAQYTYEQPEATAYAPVYAPPQIIRIGADAPRDRHSAGRIAVISGGYCPPQAVSRGSARVIARY